MDYRDYSNKIGIAEIINMKKTIEIYKLLSAQYWADFAKV